MQKDLDEAAREYGEALRWDSADPEALYFGDHTHTSLPGAELNASCVVKGLKVLTPNPVNGFLSGKANEANSCEVKIQ